MFIIAQDGSGDFSTVQAAIDAVPAGKRTPAILLVRRGIYRERVVVNKDNVRLVGEDRDSTVIVYNACAKDRDPDGNERGTFLSATVLVTGRDVEFENLTVMNDAGDGDVAGQAVALYAAGDRGVYRNCSLLAHQDTLFTGPVMPKVLADIAPRTAEAECVGSCGDCPPTDSRLYFEGCFIRGDIDFIFGPYRVWFERCTLYMNARGGWYTAANTPEKQPYGFVFHRCRLTGECASGAGYLGRPWRRYARTLFIECDMDEHVAAQGFRDWDEIRVVTERCGEYGTTGAREAQTPRHPRQKRLTADEAGQITLQSVLGGQDGWQPARRIPTWYMCGDSTMADYPPDRYPMAGWGQVLQDELPESVFVENCAVNGRSSKSFVNENRLRYVDLCLRAGDKLIVSFGHNDEKAYDPSRYTDPNDTFKKYLGMFLDAAEKHGAEPVLVTPIARRCFDAEGRLVPTHGAYPEAIRSLASERKVRLIDLEKATMLYFSQAGEEGTKSIFCHVPAGHPNYPQGAQDNSHLHENGAHLVARMFVERWNDPAWTEKSFEQTDTEDCAELIAREDDVLKERGMAEP